MPSNEPATQFVVPQVEVTAASPLVEKPATEVKPDVKVETKVEDKPIDKTQEEAIVDFNSILEATGEQQRPEVKVEAKPDKISLETKPTVETKPDTNKPVIQQPDELEDKTNRRDYTGIEESAIPLFKKMSNKSFDALKPVYLEHKQLKESLPAKEAEIAKLKQGALPENYYEHDRAYTLTPEFEQIANNTIKAGMIVNHWEQQLAKIKSGDETYQEIHINSQDGNLYPGKPVKATKESEAEVEQYLAKTKEQHLKFQMGLKSLGESHKAKHQESVGAIQSFESTAFKNLEGDNAKIVDPIIKDIIEKVLPPAFHNSPLARPFAKAMYVINRLGEQLKANKAAPATNGNGVSADKIKAGPTSGDMAGGLDTKTGTEMPTYDEIQAEIGGRRT